MSLDKMQDYGNTFQLKVLAALLREPQFVAQMLDALKDDLFDSDSKKEILKILRNYYTEFRACPTKDVFEIKIQEVAAPTLAENMKSDIKEMYLLMESAENLPFVKKEFADFCFYQGLKAAILQSVDKMTQGKNLEVKSIMDNAYKAFQAPDLGHEYENQVEDRLVKKDRIGLIPTEWPVINEIIDGGPGEGDLCILVGAAGSSKTWALVSIGMHAVKLGKNVVHFTLELNENYTAKRYDSKLTGIQSKDLKYHCNEVVEAIEASVKGKLRIFFHPTKSATINTLKRQLDMLIAHGINPDLVIVDYADLLRNDNIYHQKGGSYSEIGSMYEDLRGLAGEYKLPVWTASQAHRSAQENEIITGDQIAESYKKVMTGDFVISVARKVEDKVGGTARWHIIKNRYGPDGITFPSRVDASIGKIEILHAESQKGVELTQQMRNHDKAVKKTTVSYFDELADERKRKSAEGMG